MIRVAENILSEGSLKERSKPTKQQQQTKINHKKAKQCTNLLSKYLKLTGEWRADSTSILDITRGSNFTLQQRKLILAFIVAAIFKHWGKYFKEDVGTVVRYSETCQTNVLQIVTQGQLIYNGEGEQNQHPPQNCHSSTVTL